MSGILFTGQSRYATRPARSRFSRVNRNNSNRPVRPDTRFDPLSIQGCFNCGDNGHTLRNCSKPLNAAKAAANKLDYYQKKRNLGDRAVHPVLAMLCQQVDETFSSTDRDEEEREAGKETITDREIFECIIGGSDSFNVKFVSPHRPQYRLESFGSSPPGSEGSHASDSKKSQAKGKDVQDEYVFTVFDEGSATVYSTGLTVSREGPEFLGACIDTGAQKSLIGNKQAVAYSNHIGQELKLSKHLGKTMFKFGDHRHKGLGTIEVRIPTDDKYYLSTTVEVVDVDVTLVLGLDFLDRFEMNIDTAKGMLESKGHTWTFPLTRKRDIYT